MCAKGVLKRFLPFFLTFAAGLFIASFFVPVLAPATGLRERRASRYHAYQRLNIENQNLRDENQRLRDELNALRMADTDGGLGTGDAFTVAPVPPPPPIRVAPRHFR